MTNLLEIRNTTKALARCVKPELVSIGFPILNSHPFLETSIWYEKMIKDSNGVENVYMSANEKDVEKYSFTNPEVYAEWLKYFDRQVDSAKNLARIYMMYRDPYKLAFMKFNEEYMNKKHFAEYLADAWVTEDNPNMDINVPPEESVKMFQRAEKKWLMEKDDYEYYQNLPEKIEVFRGVSVGRLKYGLSWTDDYEKAEWFRNRFENIGQRKNGENKCMMLKAIVDKKDVLAYFNTRNEKELVVNVFNIMDRIEEI